MAPMDDFILAATDSEMRSALTWLDHDAVARERSLRILALFRERDSRDELGLGAIRDSFSDKLFPGTSTIQTRLRYMLVVPWVYRTLEAKRTPSNVIAARARRFELDLIRPLLDSDDRSGVFGVGAGRELKRLPSEVYWSGLGEWRIRRFPGSIGDYHNSLDRIYKLRGRQRDHVDDDETTSPEAETWHPRLPDPPEGFPEELDLSLTQEEAEFLRDSIVTHHGASLLGWLVREGCTGDAEQPWEHPDWARFPASAKELLGHARLFSDVMLGAAILYNLALAEVDGRTELAAEHKERIAMWAAGLDRSAIAGWSLPDLWQVTEDSRHMVMPGARRFVESWVRLVRKDPNGLDSNPAAQRFVEARERHLKKGRSRFRNARAREQWSGHAGDRPMTFRWPTARRFLDDLARGLRAG